MKSAIFYGSPNKLTNAHKLVSNQKQAKYYVRMDTIDGDCEHALEHAKPMEGETVLNTVNLTLTAEQARDQIVRQFGDSLLVD